jgi:hypothetical protein
MAMVEFGFIACEKQLNSRRNIYINKYHTANLYYSLGRTSSNLSYPLIPKCLVHEFINPRFPKLALLFSKQPAIYNNNGSGFLTGSIILLSVNILDLPRAFNFD